MDCNKVYWKGEQWFLSGGLLGITDEIHIVFKILEEELPRWSKQTECLKNQNFEWEDNTVCAEYMCTTFASNDSKR